MKKIYLSLLLVLGLFLFGNANAQTTTSCQSQLSTYKRLYKSQLDVSKVLLGTIKDTNEYIDCLRQGQRGEIEFYECNSLFSLYMGERNILYKYGLVGFKIYEY